MAGRGPARVIGHQMNVLLRQGCWLVPQHPWCSIICLVARMGAGERPPKPNKAKHLVQLWARWVAVLFEGGNYRLARHKGSDRAGPGHRRAWLAAILALSVTSVAWAGGEAGANATSVATPTTVPIAVHHNLAYGEHDGRPLLLDVYEPAKLGRDLPGALMIHGGGWWSGSKAYPASVGRFLARSGWVAFAVNYTLDTAKLHGYPLQVAECQEALRWMEEHAAEYHMDVHRLVVYGGSAGGYLAAMVAVLGPGKAGFSPVSAAVSISGPLNPDLLVQEYRAGGPCRPKGCAVTYDALNHLSWFLGCPLSTCPSRLLTQASPVDHVTKSSPPFFIYDSSEEIIPLSQATTMVDRLKAVGVPAQLDVIAGETHGPPSLLDIKSPVEAFLAAYVPPAPPSGSPWVWAIVAVVLLCVVAALRVLLRRRSRRAGALS